MTALKLFKVCSRTRCFSNTLLRISIVLLVCLVTSSAIGCSSDEAINPPLPITPEAVARGEELVEGLGSCGFCHSMNGKRGSALSGGRLLLDEQGEVRGSNITLAKSGLRGWRESDVVRAFREYAKPDDSEISRDLHNGFEWLSDADISAITGYIRSLRPVENEIEPRSVSMLPSSPLELFRSTKSVKGFVPSIQPKYPAAYGQYLADHVARCGMCHNSAVSLVASEYYWAGGREISLDGEVKVAPNITSSKTAGIGDWSEKDVKNFLKTGRLKDGRSVDSRFCPVEFYRASNETDISALVSYIRSVLPVD